MTNYTSRIQGVSTAVAIKAPVKVATTGNITLSGTQTIDGVAVIVGDRVLVKDQTDATENGIWVVASGAWSRARDFNGARDVVLGTEVYVVLGTANADLRFAQTATDPVIGVTELSFSAISGTVTQIAEDARDAAIAAAAAAVAAADATPVFSDRDEATTEATGQTGDAEYILVAGLLYAYDASGTALTTGDGRKWSPAGTASPGHWGAIPFVLSDQSAAVQAAIDWVRTSWDAATWAFENVLDFKGLTYVCDQSIDCTGIRQPRLTMRNGGILSRAAGKIALDACLTNGIIFDDFTVYGDEAQSPAWGFYVGRGLLNGAYPGVDGVTFTGRSGAWGHFTRGGLLSLAAEVTRMGGRTFFHNRSRELDAVAVACVDSMGAITRHFGSETTSDFQTLPTAVTGNHSNVCHEWGQTEFRRVADYNLTITSISKAAQAVVSVTAGTLAAANISIGDEVFISGGDMTEIAYKSYTVAAVGTDALTLNVDSTGFTTYTGGATLQNRTGPGLLSSGMRTVTAGGAYILTYGSPCVVIDGQGGAPYDWHVQVQFERHTDKPITVKIPSGTVVVPQFHISATNTSQTAETAVIWVEGAGTLRLDGGSLKISNMAAAPSQSVLAPQSQVRARGFDIDVPLQAALPTSLAEHSGRTLASDRTPAIVHHTPGLTGVKNIEMDISSIALTGIGMRWASGGMFVYRPEVSAERKVHIQDSATDAQLNSISDRVNTTDKYEGKPVWKPSVTRHVYAVGGAPSSVWVYSDGTIANTPV